MNKYNIHTKVFKQGKCTYKIRNSDFGKDEIVEHNDAPLLAPRISIFENYTQYDFSKILVTSMDDLNHLIENLIEIRGFIESIGQRKKEKTK